MKSDTNAFASDTLPPTPPFASSSTSQNRHSLHGIVTNPAADADNDGINNLTEYNQGLLLSSDDSDGDGLKDGDEITAGTDPQNPDTDGDGMPDGYEVANGLNPLLEDSFEDKDGDRYPNIFEYKRGTKAGVFGLDADPSHPVANPPPIYVVAKDGSGTHTTIRDAIIASTGSNIQDYAVIRVKPGTFEENVITSSNRKLLLIADVSPNSGPVVISGSSPQAAYTLEIYGGSVVDGFVITHNANVQGSGVYVGYGDKPAYLLDNIIRDNKSTYGGGLYNTGNFTKVVNCTIWHNSASYYANGIYNSGTLALTNSIVWNQDGQATGDIYTYGTFTATKNFIRNGNWGATNLTVNPQLSVFGLLKSGSPAINAGIRVTTSVVDFNGERRDQDSGVDIGADEMVDTDNDSLPDAWEKQRFGNLNAQTANGDPDVDGLNNAAEFAAGTNPMAADSDLDGLTDAQEVNTHHTNPLNSDSDGDGLNDYVEVTQYHTNPNLVDSDSDGMTDQYEVTHGLNPNQNDATADTDGDGLTNMQEFQAGTNPNVKDTDGDGLEDGAEVNTYHTNPLAVDSDKDDLTDAQEVNIYHSNPNFFDTDGDLLPDGFEAATNGLHVTSYDDPNGDLDGDGLSNLDEYRQGSKADKPDTDGDGTNDGDEVDQGGDPTDPNDGGQPPAPGTTAQITLTVGDHSGSHSERYVLNVGRIKYVSPGFGEVGSQAFTFKKGQSYSITVAHAGTDPNYHELPKPDYDYTAKVEGCGGVVIDEGGILGVHDESDPFFASGKSATLIVPKVEVLMPDNSAFPPTTQRDKIFRAQIKVTPSVPVELNFKMDITANKTQALGSRSTVQMFDFGTTDDNSVVTSTENVIVTPNSSNASFLVVFNREGKRKVYAKSENPCVEAYSAETDVDKTIRKYGFASGYASYDLNQYDGAIQSAANTWAGVYDHSVDTLDRIKAICMLESYIGASAGNQDIMTITNAGDHVLDSFHNVPPYDDFAKVIRGKSNGKKGIREPVYHPTQTTRLLSYPQAAGTPQATNILWGTCWFYQKAATIVANPAFNSENPQAAPEFLPGTWKSWDTATARYNGGGDSNYMTKFDRVFNMGYEHPLNSSNHIWPILTNGKAR